MATNNSSALAEKLKELCAGPGVRRKDLYDALGEELRHRWQILPADRKRPERVRAIVTWQVERLIPLLRDPKFEPQDPMIVRVSFNVSIPTIIDLDLTRRREWLANLSKRCVSASTSGRRIKKIRPFFADALRSEKAPPTREQVMQAIKESAGAPSPLVLTSENRPAGEETAVKESPDQTSSANSPKKQRPLIAAASVAGIVLTAAAALFINQFSGKPQAADPTPTSSRSFEGNALRHNGQDIKVELLKSTTSTGGGWDVAFSKGSMAKAQPFLNPPPVDNPYSLVERELDAGGYSLNGIDVSLKLSAVRETGVTIYNIRPIVLSRDQMPLGAATIIGTQGGEVAGIRFDMEDKVPVGYTAKEGERVGGRYFDSYNPQIAPGATGSQVFRLSFVVLRQSLSFRIAIDYSADDKQYTQIVSRDNGEPFRIAAAPCPPSQSLRAMLSSDELASLKKLQYSAVTAWNYT